MDVQGETDGFVSYSVAVGVARRAVGICTVTSIAARFLRGFWEAALRTAFLGVNSRMAFVTIGFESEVFGERAYRRAV
jgi:hypothetical protein